MLEILTVWRKLKWPIFHVQHRSKDINSVFWPQQQGFEFKKAFQPLNGEQRFEKTVPCAFVNNVLEGELRKLGVNELVIVGAATNNSVEATARTGGNLGFTVYVVEDACFTFAKLDYFGVARSAEDVHAMSLANMHEEYARVINCVELIKKTS